MMNIDYLGRNNAQGEVANAVINNEMNLGEMRPFMHQGKPYVSIYKGGDPMQDSSYKTELVTQGLIANGTLRRDEWKQLDDAILPIARNRLNGIADLEAHGLVYTLGNAMGTTVLEWHDVSDSMEAELTMDGVTRSKGDRPIFSTKYLPIPVIHVDYEINARVLAASRKQGNPLDVTSVEHATRRIAEYLESMLFTDIETNFADGKVQSYINYDNRNTITLASKWDNSGVTGALIIADVMTMKQASMDAKHYGDWMLYVPSDYETTLDEDYSSSKGTNTIRERILQIRGIMGVKVVDTLPDDNVLLVQMTSDVVRLVKGMGIQNVQWDTEGRWITKYKVMTIQVPQLRADQDGNCGINHATFTA